jgi:Beta-mannanase
MVQMPFVKHCLLALLLPVTVVCLHANAAGGEAATRLEWGVYQIHWGGDRFAEGIASQTRILGAAPQYVLFFQDLSDRRGFPTRAVEACLAIGATPVISQELWEWRHRHSDDDTWLFRINRGDYDEKWRTWARDAKDFEHRIIFRFGFEMNGDWFDWGQQPAAFIAAWQRVYSIVRHEIGATNVEFMFSPNVEWDAYKPLTKIELYYPGDDYVDLLGLDGYNFGDHHSEWHRWQSYSEIFEASLKIMSQWPQKLYLSEIGCADGSGKSTWIEDFLNSVQKDSRISGFIYYNHFDGRKGEPNWRLDSDPETLEVFRKFATQTAE